MLLQTEDSHLTPEQRCRQVAAILARGVLRLRTTAKDDARPKALELCAATRPDVTRG